MEVIGTYYVIGYSGEGTHIAHMTANVIIGETTDINSPINIAVFDAVDSRYPGASEAYNGGNYVTIGEETYVYLPDSQIDGIASVVHSCLDNENHTTEPRTIYAIGYTGDEVGFVVSIK